MFNNCFHYFDDIFNTFYVWFKLLATVRGKLGLQTLDWKCVKHRELIMPRSYPFGCQENLKG